MNNVITMVKRYFLWIIIWISYIYIYNVNIPVKPFCQNYIFQYKTSALNVQKKKKEIVDTKWYRSQKCVS